MKSRIAALALMVAAGFGPAAQADEGRREWRGDGQRAERQWRGEHRHEGRHDGRRWEHRRDDRHHGHRWEHRRDWHAHRHHAPRWHAPQYQPRIYHHAPSHHAYGYSAAPQYRVYHQGPRYWVGGYVPHHYRAHRYWVHDWHTRQLWAPPYGHQWVQTDTGEILLIALATGLIAHALMSY